MSESETPSDSSTVSPSDAITETDLDSPDTPDADPDASADNSISITDMLLSSEPDEKPEKYDADDQIAHAIIGLKKSLKGAGMDVKEGVPAIYNYGMAALGFLSSGDEDAQQEAEQAVADEGGVV